MKKAPAISRRWRRTFGCDRAHQAGSRGIYGMESRGGRLLVTAI